MTPSNELASFIASSFRSIWALELLLLLKREGRSYTADELVALMRASRSVLNNALESLTAAGLTAPDDGSYGYAPVSPEVAALVDETEQLYQSRPNRVRRLIVASNYKGLTAFADAFRLKD